MSIAWFKIGKVMCVGRVPSTGSFPSTDSRAKHVSVFQDTLTSLREPRRGHHLLFLTALESSRASTIQSKRFGGVSSKGRCLGSEFFNNTVPHWWRKAWTPLCAVNFTANSHGKDPDPAPRSPHFLDVGCARTSAVCTTLPQRAAL